MTETTAIARAFRQFLLCISLNSFEDSSKSITVIVQSSLTSSYKARTKSS